MRTPGGEANAKVINPHHDNPQEDPKKKIPFRRERSVNLDGTF